MAFNLIIVVLLPALYIAIGTAVLNGFTYKINHVIGYRTPRSMRCIRSWSWAQSMMGEYLLFDGAILIIPSIAAVVLVEIFAGSSEKTSITALVILLIQTLSLIFVIAQIESNLKKEHHRWDVK